MPLAWLYCSSVRGPHGRALSTTCTQACVHTCTHALAQCAMHIHLWAYTPELQFGN